MRLLACLASFIPVLCYAATINLPLPTIGQIAPNIPTTCTQAYQAHPYTIVTGFDATGNYVLGSAANTVACGHSGRYGTIHYYGYCASFVWDLSGNLISTKLGTCGGGDSYTTYTNAGGYSAYTFVQYDYGYLQDEYPVLVTP